MDKLENSLSLEQQFNHKIFSDRVQQLSREEAIELIIQMHKQMLFKDNLYKQLLLDQGKQVVDSLFGVN